MIRRRFWKFKRGSMKERFIAKAVWLTNSWKGIKMNDLTCLPLHSEDQDQVESKEAQIKSEKDRLWIH